jgi:TolA-binding protein
MFHPIAFQPIIKVKMMKLSVFVLATLLVPSASFAASREQQEMQRDIAQLQDQVRTLQSGFDQKMAALQTLVQQALEAANKANTTGSVLTSTVSQTMERELRDRLAPVAGVSAKVDNLSNDMAEVKNSLSDLSGQLNKLRQQLTDVNNAVKVIQAPPAPPPGADLTNGKNAPPVPASTLFTNAMGDYSSGKSDLAASEFADFVKFYPDDAMAPTAQLYIGQIHFAQAGKVEQAVLDFDTILERFPDSKVTPDAWFMKGVALQKGNHRDDAAKEFRNLIAKYPKSDQAKQAGDQLKTMGLSVSKTPAAPVQRKKIQ